MLVSRLQGYFHTQEWVVPKFEKWLGENGKSAFSELAFSLKCGDEYTSVEKDSTRH